MKSQIKSILIPTDFSESSKMALNVGISIAKRQKAKVVLLHVLDSYSSIQPAEFMFPGINLPPDLKTVMEEKIKTLAASISEKSGVSVTGTVSAGMPFEQICMSANKGNISLIVIGSHGTSGIRKFFMGSDAYRVIKNSPCPVLTVPGNWTRMDFKKILFPIRLIPGALEKYFYARPVIEKNNSELFLLGLTDMKDPENTKELTMLIGRLKYQLNIDNVKYQCSYIPGEDFPLEVAKTAKENDNDLIILTANIDNDWRSFFVGPFVQQVINHSLVPVLSIKPPDHITEAVQPYKLAEQWGRSLNLSPSV